LETLEILGFAKVSAGDIQLSDLGKQFSQADLQERKRLFAQRLLEKVPLARYIRRVLDEKAGNRVSEERFLSKLEDYLSEKEALEVVATLSPKSFYELKIYNSTQSKLLPKDLESFFAMWENRTPKKSLNLVGPRSLNNKANVKIFERYKNLGVIRKFVIRDYDEELIYL
jgi:hypothetical protein